MESVAMEFAAGEEVEVCPDEDGFAGAYLPASVVRFLPNTRRYTVAYLCSDRETLPARLLRPRQPPSSPSSPSSPWRLHDAVDAFRDGAWWSGLVVEVGSAEEVSVCFPLYREVLRFPSSLVRPHLEWLSASARWMPPALLVRLLPLSSLLLRSLTA